MKGRRRASRESMVWTLAFGQLEDRNRIGYAATREAAMAAFAKSWRCVLINAQIAAPLLWAIHIGCPKNCTRCYRRSGDNPN
jgi:hypothetical protein